MPLPPAFAQARGQLLALLEKIGDLQALRGALDYAAGLHEACDELEGRKAELARQVEALVADREQREMSLAAFRQHASEETRRLRGEMESLRGLRAEAERECGADRERLEGLVQAQQVELRRAQTETQAERQRLAEVRAEVRRVLTDIGER